MRRFTSNLDVRVHPNGRLYKLLQPLTYVTSLNPASFGYSVELPVVPLPDTVDGSSGWVITVKAGFVTDFASVPRFAWSLIPPTGCHSWPSVIHDHLYVHHPEGRLWADKVFLEGMETQGSGFLLRSLCYCGVRAFGRRAWDRAPGSRLSDDKGWDANHR